MNVKYLTDVGNHKNDNHLDSILDNMDTDSYDLSYDVDIVYIANMFF